MAPLLQLSNITKRYGAIAALNGVHFEVTAGEVVALVGDNGAGKSTLVKVISGVGPLTAGEIHLRGEPVQIDSPSDAAGLGIATVYQDLALCENLNVAENLYMGRLTSAGGFSGRLGFVDYPSMEVEARRLLDSLGVSNMVSVKALVGELSGGQRQCVAIARSLIGSPDVVILDEPTAALGVVQTAQVLNIISKLREQGLAVVLISHNLEDVLRVADRVAVLRLGRNAGVFDIGDTTHNKIVAAITGAEFGTAAASGVTSP